MALTRLPILTLMLGAALAPMAPMAPALAGEAASGSAYPPVTDARLAAPEARNWLMYRGSYNSWGYSELAGINTINVKSLKPLWTFSTGMTEAHQAPPIVNDGHMFITTPQNHVLALDAQTGALNWRYARELPEDLVQLHPTNRGVALHGDKVYLATVDAFLVALDATTGEVVWEQQVEDYLNGYYMTLAPLAAEGLVLVGVSGGEFGIRGFIQAFDAATGKPAWKTYTVPGPGEPGNDSWPGDSWKRGGAPAWVTGSYDAKEKITYWGTGNAGPWIGEARPGDNLYATSVLALDIHTGKIRAHHQYHWNDSWDWDEVAAPVLIEQPQGEQVRKTLVHAGRDGYLWTLERKPDALAFIDARPYVKQNVYSAIDPTTGRPSYVETRVPKLGERVEYCPSLWGGKDWPPVAYSPQTGYLYIPANENLCGAVKGEPVEYRAGEMYMGVKIENIEVRPTPEAKDHIGELQAWDLASGKRVWTNKFASHNWGPVLATAGDLVFSGGTNDRQFRAFDARTGDLLWQQGTNSGVVGVPISYEVEGRQYIAVQSGWGVDAERKQQVLNQHLGTRVQVPQGGVLWVFGLAD